MCEKSAVEGNLSSDRAESAQETNKQLTKQAGRGREPKTKTNKVSQRIQRTELRTVMRDKFVLYCWHERWFRKRVSSKLKWPLNSWVNLSYFSQTQPNKYPE